MSTNQDQNFEAPSQAPQYSWLGVLEFLQDQYKEQATKETEWVLEKQQLQDKVTALEAELKASEQINYDLIKRVKMLEFSLRQERIRFNKTFHDKPFTQDLIKEQLEEQQKNQTIAEQLPKIPKRKAKEHRALLSKILEEVGLEDIFKSTEYKMQEQNYEQNIDNLIPESVRESQYKKQQEQIQQKIDELDETKQQIVSTMRQKAALQDITNEQHLNQNNQSLVHDQNTAQNVNLNSELVYEKINIRAHFDGVRDAVFVSDEIFVTVSEDCLIKLYDTNQFQNDIYQQSQNLDPYFTLREHQEYLFTVDACPKDLISPDQNIFFTSGAEGIIKCFNVPNAQAVDQFSATEQYRFCIATWQVHENLIWQIVHNPYDKQILSSCSEGSIKLFNYKLEEDEEQQLTCLGDFVQQYNFQNYVPTSTTFIHSNQQLIASGYMDTNQIGIFRKESGQIDNIIKYQSQSEENSQVNKLISHNHLNSLISGHDDGTIRIFDLNQNKQTASIENAHNIVKGLTLTNQNDHYLYSVGDDGLLKTWDLRNQQCLHTHKTNHLQKYQEIIHNIKSSSFHPYLATAGADGNVGIYGINQ
ncbi:WD40-repeat-containing domain [Pseudocohnilembus persalinus]|uniref:WD40-repeat-containing domain n=1 Tax=Pseudocohnilembus persalinus TaxID=266149 RepID=A0A0V0R854_PSEPJ|nr:WD40-repeat-containing domain [Pseudocohnilembus persalinus]|eukprot:KRX10679.1 WD40-repeat-containing domain [Pseudocohnilembus persalinus]